ncbi:hypothetical protein C1N32_05440 [Vibrio diazotrophicus]|uniref:Lipoprotein n=1 Tax=Vibrio diazotrophicus TaxID=685 RepID=A0A2J8I4T8_VIBDI|nr:MULTISPECIES: hypothetical protein [Vibrio]MCF7361910.1 hypothetical protein [Vibrio sp. A1-b2]PNI05546.1 hypothetical protein C1N32_05440 [Vibrio diazotrophicus]
MNKVLLLCVLLLCGGCSQLSDYRIAHADDTNTTVIYELAESFEFDEELTQQPSNPVESFIKNVNHRYPQSQFVLSYVVNSPYLFEHILRVFKAAGIDSNRITIASSSEKLDKPFKLSAHYALVKDPECGSYNFLQREVYKFGCALEYNRAVSLSNPIGEGR